MIVGRATDVLRHGAGILLIDVLRRDLHIDQRGFDIGVPISCMSAGRLMPARTMSEAKVCRKRCGLALDAGGSAMMTEQGTQSGGCHAGAACRPFE